MIVVSNTSPLNYLIQINLDDIFHHLFGTISIPNAVREELSAAASPDPVKRWISQPPEWLKVIQVSSPVPKELESLHFGECEAILLAEQLSADILVLDERAARTVASQRNLSVIGTLGVLNEAGNHNLIDIPEAVNRLRNTTFRAAPSLYKWLLDQHQ